MGGETLDLEAQVVSDEPTPDPSKEGSIVRRALAQFPSWEGSGAGSWIGGCAAIPAKLVGLVASATTSSRILRHALSRNYAEDF